MKGTKRLDQILRAVLALALVCLIGCSRSNPVAWSPDSQAIIFTDKGGLSIVEYDIRSKTRQVIVEETGTPPAWLGISRDCKELMILKGEGFRIQGSTSVTNQMQLEFRDRSGGLQKKSSVLTWTASLDKPANKTETTTFKKPAVWSHSAGKLITDFGIYDFPSDSWTKLRKGLGLPFDAVRDPVRPDGAGFLGVNSVDQVECPLCFVTWDGKAQEFKLPEDLPEEQEEGFQEFRWEGKTARFTTNVGYMDFNTETMTLSFTPIKGTLNLLPTEGNLLASHRFGDGNARLCLFEPTGQGDPSDKWWLEIQFPGINLRKKLLSESNGLGHPSGFGSQSADGSQIVLPFDSDTHETLVIIDSGGQIMGTVERDHEEPPSLATP